MYHQNLKKKSFSHWKLIHSNYILKEKESDHFYFRILLRNFFLEWSRKYNLKIQQTDIKNQTAIHKFILRKAWRSWTQIHLEIQANIIKAEEFNCKNILRLYFKQWTKDFQNARLSKDLKAAVYNER